MSTGISISSINRIKELAEEKKFKEALEILDTQNLDKSINPQFLRISGEIFRENKRYYDSRRILLKAHQMSPQGNRIIYELIQLYLELGYFSKAQKYYEQYMYYATPDDTQKDYVEYIMKKANGEDVKDLAAVLIPILEQMPEDKWNFEAVLLYHKIGRKDMALEECRYILENFKESEYVQPVIDYIDDKLDVDTYFYVYPNEEQEEDIELFGNLIEQEEKILKADYLLMYPPEARIMVEAEDKDPLDVVPAKEKKQKKSKKKAKTSKKAKKIEATSSENEIENSDIEHDVKNEIESDIKVSENKNIDVEEQVDTGTTAATNGAHTEEQSIKEEREVALEAILAKKFDTEKIKESAKLVANAVKDIDTDKAKQQVKLVTGTLRDNVKKATDVLGEAVGTKQALQELENKNANDAASDEESIVDGIIESVLEPPKKTVGQVVTNEELDALIPDSLEAMSEEEVAGIEARRVEEQRLELEALETKRKLAEEKKAKKQAKEHKVEATGDITEKTAMDITSEQTMSDGEPISVDVSLEERTSETVITEQETASEETMTEISVEEEGTQESATATSVEEESTQESATATSVEEEGTQESTTATSVEEESIQELVAEDRADINIQDVAEDGESYEELKKRYINDLKEMDESPLESLGFITVVHSDVDDMMKEAIPEAADILSQTIDDKEFYSGETSLGFESKASYQNHGFEVEDFDFEMYKQQQEAESGETTDVVLEKEEISSPVEVIFAQGNVIAFEDIIPEQATFKDGISENDLYEETIEDVESEVLVSEEIIIQETDSEEMVSERSVLEKEALQEDVPTENLHEDITVHEGDLNANDEQLVSEDCVVETEEIEEIEETIFSDTSEIGKNEKESVEQEMRSVQESLEDKRNRLRIGIVLTIEMDTKLLALKESR